MLVWLRFLLALSLSLTLTLSPAPITDSAGRGMRLAVG